jgi:hypothetical protein
MCEFFSCIVKRDGEVIWDASINSHDELIEKAGLKDETAEPDKLEFARVEITCDDIFEKDLKKWKLKIDEAIEPTWWHAKHEIKAYEALKECLDKHILDGVKIETLENIYIIAMRNSTVKNMWENSTVEYMRDNSIAIARETKQIYCSNNFKIIKK